MTALVEMTGRRYGRLTVISRAAQRNGSTSAFWLCSCDCGRTIVAGGQNLRTGNTKSCGCRRGNWNSIHGHNRRGKRTPEYSSWCSMRRRCNVPSCEDYPDYGGRGIRVCERWLESFENFLEDMGERPSRTSLDRYPNNDGNYEPGNCRWATHNEQARNRRKRKLKTHCMHEHPLSGENLYITTSGKRQCKECRRRAFRQWHARKKHANS